MPPVSADSTYLDQFNNAQTTVQNYINLNTGQQGNLTNQFNRLNSIATIGENAAAGLGAQGHGAGQSGEAIISIAAGLAISAQDTTGASPTRWPNGVNNYLALQAYQETERTDA